MIFYFFPLFLLMLFFDLFVGMMEISIMEMIATVAVLTLGVGWPLSFLGYNLSICSSNLILIFSYSSINNFYDFFGKKLKFLIFELDKEILIPFIIFCFFFHRFPMMKWPFTEHASQTLECNLLCILFDLKFSENPLIYILEDQSGKYSAK